MAEGTVGATYPAFQSAKSRVDQGQYSRVGSPNCHLSRLKCRNPRTMELCRREFGVQ